MLASGWRGRAGRALYIGRVGRLLLSWSAALLCATSALAAQTPSGWQIVRSPKPLVDRGQAPGLGGQCRVAVPPDWAPGLSFKWATNMRSPPAANRGDVSLREFSPSRSFADAKRGVTRFSAPAAVFEDSGTRYWYRVSGSTTVLTEWEVIRAGHPVCAAHIGFNTPAMEPIAREIALSLQGTG